MRIFVCFLLASSLLFAKPEPPPMKPWLTGSLIAPVGFVIPRGHFDVRSFVFTGVENGVYDNSWSIHGRHNFYTFNPQVVAIFGLLKWMDLQISPQFFWNSTHGHNAIHIGDLPIALDFQLYPVNKSWFPGVKFTLQETFPIGRYKNFNPKTFNIERSGTGSFATDINLLFYKVYHIRDDFFVSTTLSLAYTINTPVHLFGFNSYGGGYGTHGRLLPGNIFTALFAFEYTFDQNWVFAMDTIYTRTQETHFSGSHGTTSSGKTAPIVHRSQDLFSFSPSVEYNFSEHFGICFGGYFSAFGRNTKVFRNGAFNLAYAY